MAQSQTRQEPPVRIEASEETLKTLQRPAPTPEQARLGILPAAEKFQCFTNFEDWMAAIPHFDGTDEEFEAFQQAIADNRAMRRKDAEEET